MKQITDEGAAMSQRSRPNLVATIAMGTAIAVIAATVVYALARFASSDLIVTPPGQESGAVSLGAVVGATVAAGILTIGLVALLRRVAHGRRWFLTIVVVGLLVSFISPLGAAEQTSTALWLSTMHIAVACAFVTAGLRALPKEDA